MQIPHFKSIKQIKTTRYFEVKLIKKLKTIKHIKTF
ncbi:conserved hypothetical protein [uncultured Citrobacter sp.]|uniref:Uncharacterized protein n=1 Tax=uncultured Citrobacter sp. TaxID=200446 RepID=A0A212I5H7_9ENTR|nr:conserved hypothetical protein [uncultured Citrobacter sp.]